MYLIVGGNGFLSKSLQSFFLKKKIGYKIINSKKIDLSCENSSLKLKKFKNKYKIIFLSAITPDKGRDYIAFQKNIDILANFLKFFPKQNIINFTYLSSDAVYGEQITKISEKSSLNPNDLYGLMHLSRENMIKDFFGNNKYYSILRPTLIYGNLDTHRSYGPNRFIQQANKDKVMTLFGSGMDKRDHIHIDDVINIIYKVSKINKSLTLNLATGKSISFKDIANKIKKYLFQKSSIKFIKNNNQPTKREFNIAKLKKIHKNFIDIEKGIKNYFN